jgi:hypothetical protein
MRPSEWLLDPIAGLLAVPPAVPNPPNEEKHHMTVNPQFSNAGSTPEPIVRTKPAQQTERLLPTDFSLEDEDSPEYRILEAVVTDMLKEEVCLPLNVIHALNILSSEVTQALFDSLVNDEDKPV